MRALVVTLLLACLGACASPAKNGTLNIEGRGALSGETLLVLGALVGAAGATQPPTSAAVPDDAFETLGWGVQAAVNTSAIDLVGGFDQRRIHEETIPEVSVGLRKRFGAPDTPFYVFALARSSRSDSDSADVFNGSALGVGVLIQFAENGFVDMNIAWQRTTDLSIENGHDNLDEGVFQIGLGWSF
jgi:hypothetical protein